MQTGALDRYSRQSSGTYPDGVQGFIPSSTATQLSELSVVYGSFTHAVAWVPLVAALQLPVQAQMESGYVYEWLKEEKSTAPPLTQAAYNAMPLLRVFKTIASIICNHFNIHYPGPEGPPGVAVPSDSGALAQAVAQYKRVLLDMPAHERKWTLTTNIRMQSSLYELTVDTSHDPAGDVFHTRVLASLLQHTELPWLQSIILSDTGATERVESAHVHLFPYGTSQRYVVWVVTDNTGTAASGGQKLTESVTPVIPVRIVDAPPLYQLIFDVDDPTKIKSMSEQYNRQEIASRYIDHDTWTYPFVGYRVSDLEGQDVVSKYNEAFQTRSVYVLDMNVRQLSELLYPAGLDDSRALSQSTEDVRVHWCHTRMCTEVIAMKEYTMQ
jgi:hypothetical protein